jgi:hypothetical protein
MSSRLKRGEVLRADEEQLVVAREWGMRLSGDAQEQLLQLADTDWCLCVGLVL